MSVQSVQFTNSGQGNTPRNKDVSSAASGGTFQSVLQRSQAESGFSEEDVKQFFAGLPDEKQIAKQAAALGLNRAQISDAMRVGGYSNLNSVELQSEIDRFVSNPTSGFAWKADGSLTQGTVVDTPLSKGSTYFSKATTINAVDAKNSGSLYASLCSTDVRACNQVGNEVTYTNQEIKDFFSKNPSTEEIANFAAEGRLTTYNLAQMLAIGQGVPYDPVGVTNAFRDLDGYALGPDSIVVKMQPGQSKRIDGLLEASWSSETGQISYTDWAREWYASGKGNVRPDVGWPHGGAESFV
jgi:hypothetical protein